MDKATVLAALNASGEISVFRRSRNWEIAFDLHNKTTGKHKSPNCGSCFREVKAWLES